MSHYTLAIITIGVTFAYSDEMITTYLVLKAMEYNLLLVIQHISTEHPNTSHTPIILKSY